MAIIAFMLFRLLRLVQALVGITRISADICEVLTI